MTFGSFLEVRRRSSVELGCAQVEQLPSEAIHEQDAGEKDAFLEAVLQSKRQRNEI